MPLSTCENTFIRSSSYDSSISIVLSVDKLSTIIISKSFIYKLYSIDGIYFLNNYVLFTSNFRIALFSGKLNSLFSLSENSIFNSTSDL